MKPDREKTINQLPIAEAARRMGTTPLNVLMHVKRGLLKGSEVNGEWVIDGRSLEQLLQTSADGKHPQVCATGCRGQHGCGRHGG